MKRLVLAVRGTAWGVLASSTMLLPLARADGPAWETRAPAPSGISTPACGAIGSSIYFAGSYGSANSTQVYDSLSDTWATRAAPSVPRTAGGFGVIGGRLYFAGGAVYGDSNSCSSSLDVFDPATAAWTSGASMLSTRTYVASAAVDGTLYVAGGVTSSSNPGVTTLEAYDPIANAWASRAPMPYATQAASGASAGGKLYVVGGYIVPTRWTTNVLVYDPASDAWSLAASMPTARGWAACTTANGRIYVAGGITQVGDSDVLSNVVESYDPVADTWRSEPALSAARSGAGAAAVAGVVYVVGGDSPANTENEALAVGVAGDTTAPTITCPSDVTVEASSTAGAIVVFAPAAVDDADPSPTVVCSPASGSTFPLGTTTVTCTATDASGNSSSCGFDVRVVDTTAPSITDLSATPATLWPADGKRVSVQLTAASSDTVGVTSSRIVAVSSSEASTSDGDVVLTGDLTLELRARRDGKGPGRVYTITVRCSDAAGNESDRTTTVTVPHDLGKAR